MYKKCKKILSLFMAMVIVLSSFPIESLADDYSGEDIREEVQERSKLIKNYLQNGSFEQVGSRWPGDFDYYDESQIQGWQTTRLISSGEYLGYIIEVTDGLEGKNVGTIRAREGNKFAELNAIEVGALYQSVKTPAPKNENEELVMRWRLYHQGRDGTDRMNVNIFDADLAKNKSKIIDKKKVEEIVNGSGYFDKMDITAIETGQKWKEYTGTYVVPRSQSETLFVFDSAKSASPSPSIGNLLDGIVFEESEMEISKESNVIGNTSEKDRSVVPGQRIEYRINAKNISRLDTTGSIVDKLPKGVKLIPESARITVNGQEALLNLEYLEETRELKFNDINFNKINDNSSTGITDDTDYTISYEVEVLNELDGITKIEGTEVELEYFDRDYRQSDFEKYGKVHTWTLKDKNEGHYLKGKLSAEKVSSKEIVKPDEIVKYTIKIENIVQNTEIEEIRVRDKLPKDVQYIEGTGRINGRSINPENIENNTLLFNISEVLGEDIVLTYDVKILANAHGKLVNQAVISGKSKIADSLIDDIRVETTIEAPESMYLSKTADKDDARIGDIVEYDINISNLGGKWSGNIEVIDKLPFGVEYQNNTSYIDGKKVEDTPIWKDNKLLIPNLEVKADKVVNVKFKVKVTEGVITGNSIINEVRAIDKLTGEEIKNESSDESKHKVLILPEIGELECEKKVFFKDGKELKENKLAKIGDKLSYEVTGKNTGDANSKIEDIEIIDRLPDGLKVVENTVSLFINDKEIKNLDISLTGKNKIIRVKPFALSKGDRFTLKYDVNVEFNAKNEEKNTAEIKGINAHTKEVLRKEVDNSIYVKTAVEILKSVNKEQVKIGESFDYRLDVENKTGGAYWSGIISDTLAEGLKLNKLFIDGIEIDKNNKNLVEINGQEIRIKGISLSSGEKKRIVLRVEADASLSNKEVENIALGYEVGMNGVVESTEIKSNKVLVKILGNLGSLDGSKKVFNKDKTELEDKALVKIGDTLSYKIRVENKGAIYSRIKNVTVEDIIPEALKLDEDSVRVVQDGKVIDCKKLVEDNILKIELPNINSGKYFEIEYDASVVDTEKTLISNTANIEGRDYYTDKAMIKTVSSSVSVKPDISISKSSNLESVKVGEEFEYTISLRNNLGGAIWKGSIEDSLAEGLEIVSSKDLEVDGQLVRIDNISLKSGEEKIVKIRVKADGSLSNKVVENIGLAKDREGNILETNKVLVNVKEVPKPVEEDKGRPIDFKSGEYIIKHVYIDKDAKLIDLLPEIKKTAFVGEKISVKAEDTSKDIDFSKYELIGPKEVEIVIKDKKQEVVFKYEDIKLNKNEHFAYLQGYPDGTIRPLANITREEVSAVIFRILDRDYRDTIRKTDNNYRDVKSNRWSNKHISTLDEGKIIKGYKDGSFRPQNKITRAEVMAMVVRFTNESIENKNIDKNSFKDIKGHWAEGYIVHGEDRGWIKGYEDGSFKPDDYITRAEFVVIINNLLDRSTKLEHMLDDRKEFIDLEEGKWYYEDMQEAINSHEHIYEDGYEIWTALKEFDVEM